MPMLLQGIDQIKQAVDILPVTGLVVPDLFCQSSMIYGNLDCFVVISVTAISGLRFF